MRAVARALLACLAAFGVLLLTLVSVPWFVLAIGYDALGDEAAFERIMAAAPISRLLPW